MSSTIAVEELRVGMFIYLDGGWLSHPFPLSSFRISSAEQIHTLRGLGLERVRWAPEKSDTAGTLSAVPGGPAEDHAARQRREQLAAQRDAVQRCEAQHAEAAQTWRQAYDAVAAHPRQAGRTTQALTRAVLDKMLVSPELGLRLVSGGSDQQASHALNTSIVSLLIGRALGLDEDELLEVGVGALMHDVGKLELPERVRHLEDDFDSTELLSYRDHVNQGVTLGQRMGLGAGALSVLAQHHEHVNGSGFPLRLSGERISLGARVVAIVNRYDNLCNPQSRDMALTPYDAMSALFARDRHRFDGVVLNAFIRMMGVYPAGSLVQLTDDRFAMVVGVNSSRPLRPRVLVHDATLPRAEALVLDLEQQPNLGIRRSVAPARLPMPVLDYLDPRGRVSYYFEPLEAQQVQRAAA